MNQAIGLIEVKGYGSAVMIADTMVKVAAVELIGVQRPQLQKKLKRLSQKLLWQKRNQKNLWLKK